MNLTTIKSAIQSWAETATGITTIFANQDGPKRDNPYATILVSPVNFVGQDEIQTTDSNGDADFKGNREFTVSLQVFGTDAMQYITNVLESLERPPGREALATSGLVFVDRLSVNDLSTTLDTRYEERAGCDLRFRTASIHSDNVGYIGNVNLSEQYNNPDGTPAYQDTSTIGE